MDHSGSQNHGHCVTPPPITKGMTVKYNGVKYDDDGHLPDNCDWAFIELGDCLVFICKRQRWSPEVMAEAWAEYSERASA